MSSDDYDTAVGQMLREQQDQDAHMLAGYADGEHGPLDWFNAETYLGPLRDTDGEVCLVSTGEHRLDNFWRVVDDELQYKSSEYSETVGGVKATIRFADLYNKCPDEVRLVPVHVSETPFEEG